MGASRGGATDGLARCGVVFEPADPPRTGRITFLAPDADVRLPVMAALPALVGAHQSAGSTEPPSPSSAFWGAAAQVALQLVARGRLLPGVSDGGFDAWRVGPLDQDDVERISALAGAMPAEASAVPATTHPHDDPALPPAGALLRQFLDAVADAMPRSPAAELATGSRPFAAAEPQHVPRLRDWADELAAGVDAGVRISLRLEMDGDARFHAVVQVHSLANPTLMLDTGELWTQPTPAVGFGARARIDAVLAIRRAARIWAPLEWLLQQTVPDRLALDDDEINDLLGGAARRLTTAGIDVHWPRELVRELTATAVVGQSDAAPADLPSVFGGDQLLSFDWRLAVGDHQLTTAELDLLVEANRPVVRLRDRWTLVEPGLVRKARERALKPLTAMDAIGAALTGTADVDGERVGVTATGWLDQLRARLTTDAAEEPIGQPAGLHATLRDYQLTGLRWLHRMTSLGLGCCLADDMGLGKTITLIALHLHRLPQRPGSTLVVCPASLLGNWEREIERFAPGTPVRRFHGTRRSLDGVGDDGFVLTTYGTMRLDTGRLAARRWGMLVADEAQHVKNPMSGTARALRRIPVATRVALTGTPVENSLSELWAILDWTTPGLLGTLTAFRAGWATPMEADRNPVRAAQLSRLVAPFLLRRRKADPGIAPELPAKTQTDQPVALTPEQAGLYRAVVEQTMAGIRTSRGIARRGLVLKLLTALKQICNHPAHYLGEDGSRLAGRSGKLELLDELVDTIVTEDGAVLVFTQYVAMARLLEHHLTSRNRPTQLLHGGTGVRRREELVRRFQDGEVPVFLLSLKAAGTGLNLTRADHVIHYDRWWNPAVEEQATDRAYRIGQTRPVQVHRMITEGTVEDRIAAMLAAKRELADAVLGRGELALTELTDNELAELVELRSAR